MKKLYIIVILGIIISLNSFSQSCLPDGIIFYSQSEIDNFQTNYPGCTEIEGNVTIGNDGYLTDITNLNGLSVLTSIGGDFHIITNANLPDFTGLGALEYIGGDFTVEDNDSISDFSGFNALTTIEGEFYVLDNDKLNSFSGLETLTTVNGLFKMGHNLTFSEFNGLSALTKVGGIEIYYIHEAQSLWGFTALTRIDGDLSIVSCHSLINLKGINLVEMITDDHIARQKLIIN